MFPPSCIFNLFFTSLAESMKFLVLMFAFGYFLFSRLINLSLNGMVSTT